MRPDERSIDEKVQDSKLVLSAIRRGGIEAMKRHIAGSVPMVSMKDGEIVYVQPEELKIQLEQSEHEA
ncbi:MAG: hypothetical protein ACRCUY_01030 [Thermoguttaceae bacterium]